MNRIVAFLKKEPVFCAAFILAVVTAFMVPPSMEYIGYIDWRVLGILLSLMLVMKGFQKEGLFEKLANGMLSRVKSFRSLSAVLIFLCFFMSMFITNDVALITFVPFTIQVLGKINKRKQMISIIVMQTIAANLGSMLTPIGNPQNLYIYGISKVSVGTMISWMLPYTAAASGMILIYLFFLPKEQINDCDKNDNKNSPANIMSLNQITLANIISNKKRKEEAQEKSEEEIIKEKIIEEKVIEEKIIEEKIIEERIDKERLTEGREKEEIADLKKTEENTIKEINIKNEENNKKINAMNKNNFSKKVLIYSILFIICLFTVFRMPFMPWYLSLGIVLVVIFIVDRRIIPTADYMLLATFIAFFVFIGNMGNIETINSFLAEFIKNRELPVGILASQVVSNVPAALLLSGFTTNYHDLLVGVNLGGLGTLIASMASLISYKLYAQCDNKEGGTQGKYFVYFTVANILFLLVLSMEAYLLC